MALEEQVPYYFNGIKQALTDHILSFWRPDFDLIRMDTHCFLAKLNSFFELILLLCEKLNKIFISYVLHEGIKETIE